MDNSNNFNDLMKIVISFILSSLLYISRKIDKLTERQNKTKQKRKKGKIR